MESRVIKIKELLDGKFPSELPARFKDLVEGRKCNWIPDSKCQEPNCKKETLL